MKTYKYKLYQHKRTRHLHRQIEVGADVWNWCIERHRAYYEETGKYLNKYTLQKEITQVKKDHPHWTTLGSQAIQDITDRIDKGYQKFFRWLKGGKVGRRVSPPKFKPRHKYKSFTLKQAGWKLFGDNRLRIGKRVYRYWKSRKILGQIKTVTVKRDALGDIYVFFVVKEPSIDHFDRQGEISVGFDFGLKTYLTGSDGSTVESPQFFKRRIQELRKAHRSLSRKKKGSRNRERARKVLARVYKKIANQRHDFHFKLSHTLTDKYDLLFFEDLNLGGMKRLWGPKVSDYAFGDFLSILKHVAPSKGCEVHQVDRWFPSTKLCSSCGYKNNNLTLADRSWTCPQCGISHDRDLNASINILRGGASSLCGGSVIPVGMNYSLSSVSVAAVDSRISRL